MIEKLKESRSSEFRDISSPPSTDAGDLDAAVLRTERKLEIKIFWKHGVRKVISLTLVV